MTGDVGTTVGALASEHLRSTVAIGTVEGRLGEVRHFSVDGDLWVQVRVFVSRPNGLAVQQRGVEVSNRYPASTPCTVKAPRPQEPASWTRTS